MTTPSTRADVVIRVYGPGQVPPLIDADLVDKVPEGARTERLMGLCELAVRPPWQGRGLGAWLHSALLRAINPRWSSLLALPDNKRGQGLYARLGYRYAGPYRNTSDGPEFDLLLLEVRPESAG
ncbi:GNAT family N-acetyltransferase [Streptomyces sp. NPDC127108]|uniref:GNAT family N-acetyltransferase n=1 Tax=Streptomyces sp. NPDC127108 TaxID=3345361 RepID=UPI00364054FC